MKLKYIDKHFVVTGTFQEMVREGRKDVPKDAGFQYSPKGDEPLPKSAVWWTDGPSTAAKLVKYATKKALAVLHRMDDERTKIVAKGAATRITAVKKERKRREKKREDFEAVGEEFDALCRETGIPVRLDFESDVKYRHARQLEPGLVAMVKGEK
ncbi:hypothetical protein LCGC14_2054840 [marine sediment metagenome]|uniref:Uncharacterized protein n=1 Tax=marine sediment metagenome TaxID=412755 RepID=A0A0F9H1D3_9ZZZZ